MINCGVAPANGKLLALNTGERHMVQIYLLICNILWHISNFMSDHGAVVVIGMPSLITILTPFATQVSRQL